jgi:transmembrane sensor
VNLRTNSGDIEATAADWFARRESAEWVADDEARLAAWLDESTAHRIAFIRMVSAWEQSGRLKALGAGVRPGVIPPRGAWNFGSDPRETEPVEPVASSRFSARVRAAAACVVIAAGALWYFLADRPPSYRTEVGAIATVPLPDGSRVTLNTDSKIHVELRRDQRHVTLDRGEAYFEVARDPARPFVVDIADHRFVAVGTEFSLRRDAGVAHLLVTEGRVRIERGGAPSAGATRIDAGTEARVTASAVTVDNPAPERVSEKLSWRTGYIVFHDAPLADAVADFNRYSSHKMLIEDPSIAGIRIGGRFRTNDAAAFLWLLQSGFPIRVEQQADRVVLTKRP